MDGTHCSIHNGYDMRLGSMGAVDGGGIEQKFARMSPEVLAQLGDVEQFESSYCSALYSVAIEYSIL